MKACAVHLQVFSFTAEDKSTVPTSLHKSENFKILEFVPHSVCDSSNPVITEHSWSLSYLSSPPLRILYFSRNSACFCRRISVCFLKPLTLWNRTKNTAMFSSVIKQRSCYTSKMCHQSEVPAHTLPSLWTHCKFQWWLDPSHPWSWCEPLPVSWRNRSNNIWVNNNYGWPKNVSLGRQLCMFSCIYEFVQLLKQPDRS